MVLSVGVRQHRHQRIEGMGADPAVVNADAAMFQCGGEVAHGREEEKKNAVRGLEDHTCVDSPRTSAINAMSVAVSKSANAGEFSSS